MYIQLSIHNQYIVALIFGCLNVAVMFVGIVGVQINQIAVFIFLVFTHQSFILFKSKVFAIYIFQQGKFLSTFVEFFIAEHSVLNENFQVIPFFFKISTVFFENFGQAVGYFFGNMA